MERFHFLFVISAFHFKWMVIDEHLRQSRALKSPCYDSLKTVQESYSCPRNKIEWEEKAKEKKCETLNQTCTEPNSFVYHCLVNAWSNGTIEVCAPEQHIFGRVCAEFNKGGALVQEHYLSECTSCPLFYLSTESYKYQECYDLGKTPEKTTKQEMFEKISSIKPDVSSKGENQNITRTTTEYKHERFSLLEVILVSISTNVIILCLIMGILLILHRLRQRKATLSGNEDMHEVREVLRCDSIELNDLNKSDDVETNIQR